MAGSGLSSAYIVGAVLKPDVVRSQIQGRVCRRSTELEEILCLASVVELCWWGYAWPFHFRSSNRGRNSGCWLDNGPRCEEIKYPLSYYA
jgi:hypothetical protein